MAKRYDLDVGKRRARRKLQEFIKTRIYYRKDAKILCFPGEFGFEIEQVYRPLGFKDHNIYGVERDPKAANKIRQRYPNINLFEGDVVEFLRQYHGDQFAVVSFDYCGHYSDSKMLPVFMVTALGLLKERAVIATNLLAGREAGKDKAAMQALYARSRFDFADGAITVEDAIAKLNEASETPLGEVRDDAVTEGLIQNLGWIAPSVRVAFEFDLKKPRGTGFAIRPGTKVKRTDNGYILEGVDKKDFDSDQEGFLNNRAVLATAIKSEAIGDIVAAFNDMGVPEAAKELHKLDRVHEAKKTGKIPSAIPSSFFDYHMGRTVVMAFYDKHGQPDLPVSIERLSYVSESGKRMVSDFIETKRINMDSFPNAIAPVKNEDGSHRWELMVPPEIGSASDTAGHVHVSKGAYVAFLRNLCYRYANEVARFCKTDRELWPKRTDLGGGEAIQINEDKLKERVVQLVLKGLSTEEIAQKIPHLSIGAIRAIRAHVTMGTYKPR